VEVQVLSSALLASLFGWVDPTLRRFCETRQDRKLNDMSMWRGVELEPPTGSPYADFLGAEWREVEPGIFVRVTTVEPDPPQLQTVHAASS
jgi:hypothetical protein